MTDDVSDSQQAAMTEVRNDFTNHQHHLNDAQRLAAGQSLGSGQVAGGCQNLIGRRLKQTGARWRLAASTAQPASAR